MGTPWENGGFIWDLHMGFFEMGFKHETNGSIVDLVETDIKIGVNII